MNLKYYAMKDTFKSKPKTFGKKTFGVKKSDDLVKYKSLTTDIESDSEDEMNHVVKEFKAAKDAEIAHYDTVTSANYYFSVYFADEAQKNEFIEKVKCKEYFDATEMFIAGKDLADLLSIEIADTKIKRQGYFKKGKRFNLGQYI